MMPRFPDPHSRLGGALVGMSGGSILESRQTPWASATFSGARHRFVLHVPHRARGCGLPALDEREFDLPGHVLADIVMDECIDEKDGLRCTIDALTVEDA